MKESSLLVGVRFFATGVVAQSRAALAETIFSHKDTMLCSFSDLLLFCAANKCLDKHLSRSLWSADRYLGLLPCQDAE
jgi:hypothetical protein